jgi:putative transposase
MRKNRKLKKGASYHVSSKINTGRNGFELDEFKVYFMKIIKRAKKKFDFSLKNFVIMNNHYHFIIQPLGKSELSKIIQWILSVFAMNYNKIHKQDGHVFRARFWSKIIDDINQLLDTFKYIANNPVKAGIVEEPCEYRFGGLYYILKGIFEIVDKPNFDFQV